MVGSAVRAGADVARSAGTAVANMVQAADAGQILSAMGLQSEELLAPVNQRLRSEGLPEVTPQQLEATMQSTLTASLQQGALDRELLMRSIAQETALSESEAQQVAGAVGARWNSLSRSFGNQLQAAQTTALRAVDTTGEALWWVFLGLSLALGAAVAGGALGVSGVQRQAAEAIQAQTARSIPPPHAGQMNPQHA